VVSVTNTTAFETVQMIKNGAAQTTHQSASDAQAKTLA
jgi:hypothetical protein